MSGPSCFHARISPSLRTRSYRALKPRRTSYRSFSVVKNDVSTSMYPFPSTRNPTAHQIFHLPPNASQEDIKTRYLDLVKIYHPDKADPSVPPDVAQARFHAITAAYDSLRRKHASVQSPTSLHSTASTASLRALHAKHGKLYTGGDDRWKDRVIVAGLLTTVVLFVLQAFLTRKQALAGAVAQERRQRKITNVVVENDVSQDYTRLGQ